MAAQQMNSGSLSLTIETFSAVGLETIIQNASGSLPDEVVPQVKYIASFLSYRGNQARTVVVESPYIDRHYSEEYRSYYATLFRAPNHKTTRAHFFNVEFDSAKFNQWLQEASNGTDNYATVLKRLNDAYLGFIVVRPIPSAPIGRTILRPYGEKESRHYIKPVQRVHLAGFNLKIAGVPFQQQEIAVGACATTAIWSALSATARTAGRRGPTPNEITLAATRHLLNNRVFPSSGLELAQLLDGIRSNGYEPYAVKPQEGRYELFALTIKCYLLSGISVIIMCQTSPDYHAMTLVGYRVSDSEETAPPILIEENASETVLKLKSLGLTRVYVHDDRLGPYARMVWKQPTEKYPLPTIQYEPYRAGIGYYPPDPMGVYAAIIPLNAALRLSAQELISISLTLRPMILALMKSAESGVDERIYCDPYFSLSRKYKKDILQANDREISPSRKAAIVTQMTFPMYIGIIRYYYDDIPICDVLCDSSDISRTSPGRSDNNTIMAFVSHSDRYVEPLTIYAKGLRSDILVH